MFKLIRNSYRSLINHRSYSFINIFGLTIGLTFVILILLWIKAETGYDRFHEGHQNIYRVNHFMVTPKRTQNMGGINAPAGPEFKANFPAIREYLRYRPSSANIKYRDNFYHVDIVWADSNFFSMLSFPLRSGNKLSCLSAADKIVLSESAASQIFGGENPMNKLIEINNKEFVVSAVAKDAPANSSISFDAVALFSVLEKESYTGWDGGLRCQTFLKLVPGASTEVLLEDIKGYLYTVINERFLKSGYEIIPYLQAVKDIRLGSDTDFDFSNNGSWKRIISFALVGLLILMTACFNFVNISTALSIRRAKEVSIRKIYGSGRKRLIVLFVTESGLSIFISLILSLLLAKALVPYFNTLIGSELVFSLLTTFEWIVITVLLWTICVFLASFYSAWYLSSIPPISILRKFTGGRRRQLSRNILVTFQFALSIGLIISCLVIYSQMRYIRNSDPGFSDENVLYTGLSDQAAGRTDIIKDKLLSLPGIRSVSLATGGMPGLNFTSNGYEVEGMEQPLLSNAVYADKDYLTTLGLRLENGRDFLDETTDQYNVLINKTFVNTAGWKEPLGKKILRNSIEYRVIGVVQDFHTGSVHNKIQPVFITLHNEWGRAGIIVIKLDKPPDSSIIKQVESIFSSEDPVSPNNLVVLNDSLRSRYDEERNLNTIFFVLSVLAILISGLGLFGLATYSSQSRKKEIGVRKVNGAMISDILTRFSTELMVWIALAIIVATPVTILIMNSWLSNFEYKTGIRAWIIITAGLVTLLIGLIAVSIATWREASRNPTETLRFE